MNRLFILFTGLMFSSQCFAHAGHDHSSMSSNVIHLLWLLPAVIAVALCILRVKKHSFFNRTNNKKANHHDV